MAPPRPLRWLHISDLHLGCHGTELWRQVREDFEESIQGLHSGRFHPGEVCTSCVCYGHE